MVRHMSGDLLNSTQVGHLVDKSPRTVVRLAEAGELVYAQKLPGPNGAYLFRRSDVAAYLAAKHEATEAAS